MHWIPGVILNIFSIFMSGFSMAHIQQFYVSPENVKEQVLYLVGDEVRHALRVLRKKVGETITAVDGRGNRYRGFLKEIKKDRVVVDITHAQIDVEKPHHHLTLAQAVPRGLRFDWVIEKGTEIGVSSFQPILSRYSIAHPGSRLERWHKLALSAMKQSGRCRCPNVVPPLPFPDVLRNYADASLLIAHEDGIHFEIDLIANPSRIILFVGPEGGFSQEELSQAKSNGAVVVTLGGYRLRSETAALVGAIKILDAVGQLG
jgi:16S rRNA (uracil1498-N3)-methyltransferase